MTDLFDDGPTDPHRALDPTVRQELHRELTGDDLVAAVYASPDSNEPRLVYGDYLLERDDPRGEFVQLQLARHASGATHASARESELFAAHVAAWTAPLYSALHPESIAFERGFLARCMTNGATIDLRDVIGHPMWLTVEDLTTSEAALVTHPCLRSVKTLRTLMGPLAALAGVSHEVGVTHVELKGASRFRNFIEQPWPEDAANLRSIHEIGALRRLRSLAIEEVIDADAPSVRELLSSKLGRQLTTLAFLHERGTIEPWEAILCAHPSLRRIAVRSMQGWHPDQPRVAVVAFERDDRDVVRIVIEVYDELPLGGLVEAVRALPGNRTIEVRSPRSISDHTLRTLRSWFAPHTVIRGA